MSKEKDNKNSNYIIGGADVGTGNLVFSKINDDGKIEINSIRDMFIYVQDDQISSAEMASTKLDYITQLDDNGEVEYHCVIGNDALKLANVFNSKINRPMSNGMLSPSEVNASPIISAMFQNIIGEQVESGQVVFSIPSQPCDIEEVSPLHYHTEVFKQIFKNIGFTEVIALNEGHSVVFSECSQENFTGIGVSFGAGQVNIALVYRGTLLLGFSVGRSGDWIDDYASKSSGIIPNKITMIKEKPDMSIKNPITSSTKKQERRTRESIAFAYKQLISYVVDHIEEYFKEHADSIDLEDVEIPLVIAGGTSLIGDFVDVFKEKFEEIKEFPIEISEIRHAKDPLSAISLGCLTYSQWIHSKK